MRTKDETKRQRIKETVFQIVAEEGVVNLSFGKIAKRAQVSSGTPYVYFADKTDMLAQIYLEVKGLMDAGLQADIDQGEQISDQLFLAVYHFAKKFNAYPLEAGYMAAIQANPKLVSPDIIDQGNQSVKPLIELYDRARAAGFFQDLTLEMVTALLFSPFTWLINERHTMNQPVTDAELATLIHHTINGLQT